MPARRHDLELCTAESRCKRTTVARWREDVVLADEHQRRRAQERQKSEQIVRKARLDLPPVAIDRGQPALRQRYLLRDERGRRLGKIAMREGPGQCRSEKLLPGHGRRGDAPAAENRPEESIRPPPGGDEHDACHSVRGGKRQLLRDRPTHRRPGHVEPLDPEVVHDAQGVRRHVGDTIRAGGLAALARVAVVDQDELMTPHEIGPHEIPPVPVSPEPHEEQHGLPVARDFIGDVEIPNPLMRHRAESRLRPAGSQCTVRIVYAIMRVLYDATMHEKFTALTPRLYEYLLAHNPPEDDVLRDLQAETAGLGPISMMQIAREQGALLTMLARILGARRAIEIGTFTGYSAISIARGLPPDGRLLCCDTSEEWTRIARRYWARAGLADRIELRIGPALDTLNTLAGRNDVDLVFIDADKTNYRNYYEALLPRLRSGGMIVFDNVLWGGQVAESSSQDESTVALRALNDYVAQDRRVEAVMIPVADGLTLVRKP